MTTRKDRREFHEFRTFCGGAKTALDPGLNSLESVAYHNQEGATPDPGPHKHCLQNDGQPEEQFGVRVET